MRSFHSSSRHNRQFSPHRHPGRRVRRLRFESLEARRLLAAVPLTTLSVPSEGLLGETLALSIEFSNNSLTDTGYGPYIDLLLPATGTDGAGIEIDDGITFSSATYLGQAVSSTVVAFDDLGTALHPLARDASGAPVVVTGTPGDQLVVLVLPFGSYTPGQPVATVDVRVDLSPWADTDTPLTIEARGGFRFGNDALDNPTADPSLLEPAFHSASVAPVVYLLTKTYHGPENETATGPNYPRQYTISVDLADGATVTSLELTDTLPENLQFVRVDSTLVHGTPALTDELITPSTSIPGGTLTRRFAAVTGTDSAADASMTFTFYVPRTDTNHADVIDPLTGDDATSQNNASSGAQWTPTDPRDLPTGISVSPFGPEHTLTDKSIAIQKTSAIVTDLGASGPSPGDTIQYTLTFQISDYFSFGDLLVTDIFSDGQRLDAGFAPAFSLTDRSGTVTGVFTEGGGTPDLTIDLSNIGNDPDPATDGSTQLVFDVSQALLNAGAADAMLEGGRSTAPDASAATGTITFRTIIQETFSDSYDPKTPNVSEGDTLSNNVTISGSIRDNADLSTTLGWETDTSSRTVTIVIGTLSKHVYAVNGSTALSSPIRVAPGDVVTYRLRYQLPMTDFDGLSLIDYLPLPIFDATTLTTFDPTVSAASPLPGTLKPGPLDTFHARTLLSPSITTSPTSNSFTIAYPSFDDPESLPSTLDLLVSFIVSSDPFADELLLTNQVRAHQLTTNAPDLVIDNLVQVVLTEPVLDITKGVVATDNPAATFAPATVGPVVFSAPGGSNPRFSGTVHSTNLGATPIDSLLTGIDAGDLVTFAITLENTGTGLNGAFDVRVRDTLPAGFAVPPGGLNLSVTDGAGHPIPFTDLGGGLLGNGIELDDSGTTGALGSTDPTSGLNIAVITYDLLAASTVEAASTLQNTATLFNFAGTEGGTDHTTTDPSDAAEVEIASPLSSKSSPDTHATIGEMVTYHVTITVPEGATPSATVIDTLDAGLAFVGLISVTTSDPSDVTWTAPVVPTVAAGGHTVTFDLGSIVNVNQNNGVAETVTISYQAVILNVLGNQQGTTLDNSAVFHWSGGALPPVAANLITVVEPSIATTKSVSVGGGGTTGDAGDAVQYTINLRNSSGVDAFDATFSDSLPVRAGTSSLILSPLFSVTDTAGLVTIADFELIGDNTNGWTLQTRPGVTFDMPTDPGRTIAIVVNGTLAIAVRPDETITNSAITRFTSIDGDPGAVSTYNANSTQRTGADGVGAGLNNYATAGTVQLDIYDATPTKFLANSSETTTSGNSVAIGEIVRYRITARLAESTAPSFQLIDQLPTGIRMLNDGTATLAFVSDGDGISSSTLSGAGLAVSGSESTLAGIIPTFVIPGSAITGGAFVSGTDPTFNLGTLVNSDSDANQEFVVIEFNALIENIVGNQSGITRNNAATVRVASVPAGVNSNIIAVSIVEPSITNLAKTADPTAGDAGDTINYQLTFSSSAAANATTAFDLQLLDTLPAELALDVGSIEITVSGATGVVDMSDGNTIDIRIGSLAPGGSILVDYEAVLLGNVQPEELVTNTANLTYTSLPDSGSVANPTGSTTPGSSGSATGERTGTGGVNDYADADNATVTVTEPAFSKIVLSTNQSSTTGSYVLIGEQVVYELSFSVVEGTSSSVSVYDQFPVGMALVSLDSIAASATLSTSVAGGFAGALANASISAGGNDFTIALDTLTNSDTNNATTETIRVTFTAVVLNIAAAQNGVDLVNAATVFYTSGNVTATAPTVTVMEPVLVVDKSPSSPAGDAGGAAITYSIVISHSASSTADAFDVALEDILPAGLNFVSGSLLHVGGVVPAVLFESGGTLTASYDSLPLGSTSALQFAATLNETTLPGQTVTNSATLAYTSLPSDVTAPMSPHNGLSTERTGNTGNPGGAVNDYRASDPAAVTVRSNNVAGFAFADHDNDATRDAGEPGIANVTVTLTGQDNFGNVVNRTTTTAPNGSYVFTALRPGNYAIEATQPTGYLDGDESVGSQGGTATNDRIDLVLPLDVQTTGTENNFGELVPATVSGLVYLDNNNDGLRQLGEAGVNAASLRLTGADDRGNPVDISITTSSDGSFSVTDLRPGTYTLTQSQPDGLLDGKDALGTQGGTLGNDSIADFALHPGSNGTGNLFGELVPARLSGTVFEDPNNNGSPDAGEAGVGDVTLALSGTDDLGTPVSRTTTTTGDGSFAFTNLRPGMYRLDETQPLAPFYFDGSDTAGSLGGVAGNDHIDAIPVSPAAIGTDYLFAELPPADPVGYVFVDVDGNGIREAGEPGVPGVLITVTGTDDLGQDVTLTDTTDSHGFYQFQYLRTGSYRITETQPAGYIDGQEENGTPPATVGNDFFDGLALTWGQLAGDYNFGEIALGSLQGRVFVDSNLNGQADPWEMPLTNVMITLTGHDLVGNPIHQTTTTDAAGNYVFRNLVPGEYRLAETQPVTYLDGADSVGSLGGTLHPDAVDQIFLNANEDGIGYDFGENGLLPELITKQYFLARNRRAS